MLGVRVYFCGFCVNVVCLCVLSRRRRAPDNERAAVTAPAIAAKSRVRLF